MEALDLAIAHPPPDVMPSNESVLKWASDFSKSNAAPDLVGYGEHAGLGEARISIAAWLGEAYADGRPKAVWEPSGLDLILCPGVSGAIDHCARRLDVWHGDGGPMGNIALVEAQTYELAPPILQAAGLEVVRVRSDQEGIDPEAVSDEVRARSAEGGVGAVRLVYLVPAYGNPTGVTLSAERRARLMALSKELHFYIIADEIYGLLGFGADPAPLPLSVAEESDCTSPSVLSISSMSKLLAPGLRVGWIHCPHSGLRDRLADSAVAVSGGSPVSALAAAAVAGACENGALTLHVQSARRLFAERSNALSKALAPQLEGTDAELWPSRGGYFLWLALPAVEHAAAIAEVLRKSTPPVHVGILPGAAGLRLCFVGLPCEALVSAAASIGDAVRSVCALLS